MVSERTDFYSFVHKAVRRRLFATAAAAACVDLADAAALARLDADLSDLLALLREHAANEERFIHPLLGSHLPEAHTALTAEHQAHAGEIDALERYWGEVRAETDPERRDARGLEFYRSLCGFIGHYLGHLADEERLLPEIWRRTSEEQLRQVMAAFQSSRSPQQSERDLRLLLPALNRAERVQLLRRLRAGLPVPAFDRVCAAAEQALGPHDWPAVRAGLGGQPA
jgi:hypothetical protein